MHIINWLAKTLTIVFLFCGSASSFAGCRDSILPVTPDSRFELYGDEALDLKTGLIWQRCRVGQSWDGSTCNDNGGDQRFEWAEALTMADGQWRLPNVKELASIVETACTDPSINTNIFPNARNGLYWSSSLNADNGFHAWGVDFDGGYTYAITKKWLRSSVRLVRDGQ